MGRKKKDTVPVTFRLPEDLVEAYKEFVDHNGLDWNVYTGLLLSKAVADYYVPVSDCAASV